MNISRTITGGIIALFGGGILISSLRTFDESGIWGALWGVILLILGIYIFFNKKEDEIDQIKK